MLISDEIVTMNEGSNFFWAKEMEDRNRLWKARHSMYYAALAYKPGSKVYVVDVLTLWRTEKWAYAGYTSLRKGKAWFPYDRKEPQGIAASRNKSGQVCL